MNAASELDRIEVSCAPLWAFFAVWLGSVALIAGVIVAIVVGGVKS